MANGIVDLPVENYLDDLTRTQHDDPVLDEMEQHARRHDFPIVGRAVGRFLEQQARAIGARRVVEIGSGFGYSAYWFARAGAQVTCSDLDEQNRDQAETFLDHADLWDRIDFHVADGSEVLTSRVQGEVDIVFCDADKERYPEHWRNAADRIRVGGLYLCDNTLWYGRVAEAEKDERTAAIDEHNRLVASDRRYVTSIVPLRDGVLTALRIA